MSFSLQNACTISELCLFKRNRCLENNVISLCFFSFFCMCANENRCNRLTSHVIDANFVFFLLIVQNHLICCYNSFSHFSCSIALDTRLFVFPVLIYQFICSLFEDKKISSFPVDASKMLHQHNVCVYFFISQCTSRQQQKNPNSKLSPIRCVYSIRISMNGICHGLFRTHCFAYSVIRYMYVSACFEIENTP